MDNRQIRVFISSTFQDMQDERDYLMKRTFPKLRRIASDRDVTLTELDLRWGITEEEARSGKVVDICLREIENSIPFFIGIIGNRYGWVPEAGDLAGNVAERFPMVRKYLNSRLSVTEMEMQFGVLERKEDMHAFFFIKEPEEVSDNPAMLRKLKAAVRSSRYPVSGYVSVEDLARQVETSFLRLLDELFPEGDLSEHQKEKIRQHSFISKLSSAYVRDARNFRRLDDFVWKEPSQFLVVTGESGLGKSSLLANWAKENMEGGKVRVIPYFCSNGGNQTHPQILKYLTDELCETFDLDLPAETGKEALEKVYEYLALRKERIVILFDAINQIADVNQSKRLNWLPMPPGNVKYIFSTLPDDATMQVFAHRSYPVFYLRHLRNSQRTGLVSRYLRSYGKKLKPEQVQLIVADKQCENTLVLKTLLDELISYGSYDTLDRQIDFYIGCESVAAFYDRVLARYEQDFGRDFVRFVLGLIATSRNGVSEEEIIHMTGVKRYAWSEFFCSFSTHLSNQSGRFVFTHNFITTTVWRRYLDGDADFERRCRQALVREFLDGPVSVALPEIPYQYDRLGEWDKLHGFILSYRYLVWCMEQDEVEIGTYWRHLEEKLPGKYSLREYLGVQDCQDPALLCKNLMRLCTVRYYPKIKEEIARKLIAMAAEDTSLATPEVYLTISDGLKGQESLEYARKGLQIYQDRKDVPGEIHALLTMSSSLYHLAVTEDGTKYGPMFYETVERVTRLSEGLYGELHPLVERGYRDMSLFCEDKDKALQMALKALGISIAIYGPDHPLTGRPYHYVGVIYRERKEWDKALHYFEEAGRVWTMGYGVLHEVMNSSFGNRGKALMNLGRMEEALSCYDMCLKIQEAIFGERGYDYAVVQKNRAEILLSLARKDAALEALSEAEKTLMRDKVLKSDSRNQPLLEMCRAIRADIDRDS